MTLRTIQSRTWCTAALAAVFVSAAAIAYWLWTGWLPLHRARAAATAGRWSQVERLLGPLLERQPRHAEANLLMGRAQLAALRWERGFEHLRLVPASSAQFAEACYHQGAAWLHLDRGAQAEKKLLECLAADPRSLAARDQLAELYLWEDRRREARRRAWEMVERAPPEHRAQALERLFRADFAEIPADERMARLMRFAAQNAHDGDAVAALAPLYYSGPEGTRHDHAVSMLRECLERQPEHVGCRAALVDIALQEDAVEARRLLDDWPPEGKDERYYIALGTLAQQHDGDPATAERCFRRVLESEPENSRVRYRLAVCLRLLGRTDQADYQLRQRSQVEQAVRAERVRELIERSSEGLGTVSYRHELGELYESLGRFKEARYWYAEALRAAPEHRPSAEGLQRLATQPDVRPVDGP